MSACRPAPPPPSAPRFASAIEVELNFNGQAFVLGENNQVALVRPPEWNADRNMRLPFWLGSNVLVPGVDQPKEGGYYVISEATLVKKLDAPDEWLIEAGSSLLKKDTIFLDSKTRYRSLGRLLPTIVQYVGTRKFQAPNGTMADLPVLRAVSRPMQWTLGGRIPKAYARFERPQ